MKFTATLIALVSLTAFASAAPTAAHCAHPGPQGTCNDHLISDIMIHKERQNDEYHRMGGCAKRVLEIVSLKSGCRNTLDFKCDCAAPIYRTRGADIVWEECNRMGLYRPTAKHIKEICRLQDHINLQEMKIGNMKKGGKLRFKAAEVIAKVAEIVIKEVEAGES